MSINLPIISSSVAGFFGHVWLSLIDASAIERIALDLLVASRQTSRPCLLWDCSFALRRARTSAAGTSSNNWMKVKSGGGSGVRMYKPPNPRLTTSETTLLLAVCQAKNVPLGEERRG